MGGKRVMMERGMKDRRYRKTEEAILTAFFDEYKKGSTMRRLAKKIRVGRSTMYTHHHAIREVIPDYERYILNEYKQCVRERLKVKNIEIKMIYFDMLVFILKNRKFFEVFLKFEDRKIAIKMLGVLENKLVEYMRMPSNSEKILAVYKAEVVEVIFEWGRRDWPEKEIEKVLADMMYLTKTARDRLMPIA